MNEIVVLILFATILLGSYLLSRQLKKPLLRYIRILSAIGLLLWIWILVSDGPFGPRLILSAMAVSTLIKELFFSERKRIERNKENRSPI